MKLAKAHQPESEQRRRLGKDFLGPFEADIRTPIGLFEDGTGFGGEGLRISGPRGDRSCS